MFYRKYIIRRFEPTVYVKGHPTSTFLETEFHADVQTLEDISETDANGTRTKKRIKVFSKEPVHIADQKLGIRADWIWFQDTWMEARSCRLSEHTLLKHYTSEFVEIPEAEIPDYMKQPTLTEEVENENQ